MHVILMTPSGSSMKILAKMTVKTGLADPMAIAVDNGINVHTYRNVNVPVTTVTAWPVTYGRALSGPKKCFPPLSSLAVDNKAPKAPRANPKNIGDMRGQACTNAPYPANAAAEAIMAEMA
mmetsp:Transcript_29430/g.57356  ORF Transcript_29430/g.57356 Transcript_29430/m.57356 type:complete len:121 (+) Transcript_29430:752-1114(+)